MTVNRSTGRLTALDTAPGDGRVLRSSALTDERVTPGMWPPPLPPIRWDQVTFLLENHVEMTGSAAFTDNPLYHLLVAPE